jgi:hypothetical protein
VRTRSEGTRCYGATGAITRWSPRTGNVERVATGLPSLATENAGEFATGPHDIDIDPLGFAFVTIGFGGDPTTRETEFGPEGRRFAREILLLPRNNRLVVKDHAAERCKIGSWSGCGLAKARIYDCQSG